MNYAYYKTKTLKPGKFLAWASTQRLTSDCPITETACPVYFEYGETEDMAVEAVCSELESIHGEQRFWKQ